jgi:hypothetical protein
VRPATPGSFTPAAPQAPFLPAPPAQTRTHLGAIIAGSLALPASLFQFMFFVLAFSAINNRAPDTDAARIWGILSVVMGAGVVGAAGYGARVLQAHLAPLIALGAAGALGGVAIAVNLRASFGFLAELGLFMFEGLVAVVALILLVVFLVLIFTGSRRIGWGIGHGLLLGHGLLYLVVALWFLLTLRSLAEQARAVHSTPFAGTVAAVAALGLALLAYRKRRA